MASTEILLYGLLIAVLMAGLYIRAKRRLSRPLSLRHRLLASGSINRA